jgi:DNA-binding CsgD family transcriptional regulator
MMEGGVQRQSLRFERTAFVGREHELSILIELLDQARAGHGGLVMLGGEPGVGKTRLAQEIIAEAQERGFESAVGHCYETDTAPPYLPFIEALDAAIGYMEPDTVLATLGDAAPEVAKLLPDLRLRFAISDSLQLSPEEERFRLLNSLRDCLGRLGKRRTLLLVLEDLHWADDSSLFLLQHLARVIAEMPLLVIATYRDTELDVGRPLARTLEDLLRNRTALRISLGRLPGDDVSAMLRALSGHQPPPSLVDVLYKETEGNPFFLEEVYQHLFEEGRLFDSNGHWRDDLRITAEDVPEGVRLVIGRRLERVSDRCRQVLSAAATAGAAVSLTLLKHVMDIDEDALLSTIEEAERIHLVAVTIEAGDERLTFAHELIRQTLLAGLSLPRRRRMHVRIARALEERHAASLDEHAAELASHFAQSSDAAEIRKAVDYGERAAAHATSIYAWAEAVQLLDKALDLLTSVGPEDKSRRCDLLLRLCDALLAADQPKRVFAEVAEEAYSLAESLGDEARAAAACQAAVLATFTLITPRSLERTNWTARLERLTPQGMLARVHRDVALGWARLDFYLVEQALAMARELEDTDAFYMAAYALLSIMRPGTERACLDLAKEIAQSPRTGPRPRFFIRTLERAAEILLAWGERRLAERIAREITALADATGESTAAMIAGHLRVSMAAIDGRLEEAIAEAGRLASFPTANYALRKGFRPLLLLGSPERVRQAEEVVNEMEGPIRNILDFLRRAHFGLPFPEGPYRGPRAEPELVTFYRVVTLEVLHVFAAGRLARNEPASLAIDNLRGQLEMLEPAASPATSEIFTLIDRHRGSAYAVLGEPEKARERFLAALAAGERMRFRPEVALVHLALAELILDHYPRERAEAFEHLELCIPEFREMKMEPSLQKAEQLLTRRGRVRPPRPVYPDGLSAREVEVLRLIAQGLTNQQIAEELTISLNTVLHHVTNILGKTGSANRVEATDYAHRRNLIQ